MDFEFSKSSCFIISLESREDRRELFVKNTNQQGFGINTFEWIKAIQDENFGGLGCAKSHITAMIKFITETENKYCCIFEDDFHFRMSKDFCEKIINETFQSHSNCEVFLFSGTNVSPIETIKKIGEHRINKVFESSSTSGYLVKREYIGKIVGKFLEAIIGMEKFRLAEPRNLIYHKFAIDQIWKELQRSDNWFCSIPMLGHQIPSFSDIEKRNVEYSKYSS